MSAVIKIQKKRICHIDTNNADEGPLNSGDDNCFRDLPNRENPYLGNHVEGSLKKKKDC